MKKALALILAAAMVLGLLAGCGDTTSSDGNQSDSSNTRTIVKDDGTEVEVNVVAEDNLLTEITTTGTVGRDLATLCILNTMSPVTFKTATNFYDPLVTLDNEGNIIPCLAESWETSEDGLTWTFHIREGATWSDNQGNVKADVVAEDWAWGLEWVLNYYKNGSYNITEPGEYIVGAYDYYDYTAGLEEDEAMALGIDKMLEMVGIEIPDDHTVVYHLNERCPYFLSVVTSLGFYSVSGDFLAEIGPENFITITYDKLWYSGPYVIEEWVENNMMVLVKNQNWWDTESTRFEKWTKLMVESTDVAYQMYLNGEVDEVQLTAAYAQIINSNPSDPNYGKIVQAVPSSVMCGIFFNFSKNNEDGTPDTNWNTAVANEAFRKCLYYGVDLTGYLSATNPFDPLSLSVNTFTAYNMSKLSDGRDYTDLVLDELGLDRISETYPHVDAEKAASLKAQAIEELTEQGVTFPIQMEVYTSSAQSDIDKMTLFKEDVEDALGSDFVQVNIHTYVSSFRQEVVYTQLSSVILDGMGASYMDPTTYLASLRSDVDPDAQMVMDYYGNIKEATNPELVAVMEEYNRMYLEADAIMDADARLEALAHVEAYAIEHALMIPTNGSRGLFLERINLFTKPANTNDFQSNRWVNVETNKDGYTAEEYNAFYRAYFND